MAIYHESHGFISRKLWFYITKVVTIYHESCELNMRDLPYRRSLISIAVCLRSILPKLPAEYASDQSLTTTEIPFGMHVREASGPFHSLARAYALSRSGAYVIFSPSIISFWDGSATKITEYFRTILARI